MTRLLHWGPAVAWALLIFYLSSLSNPPGAGLAPDYAGHSLLFGLFAWTLVWAVTRGLSVPLSPARFWTCWGITVVYGALDEWHQSFVPQRTPEVADLIYDATGAILFLLVAQWLYRRWSS